MILLDYLRENELTLSRKGYAAMAMAIKQIYPTMDMWYQNEDMMVSRVIVIELPEADCLKILQLTAKYAGLWAFA